MTSWSLKRTPDSFLAVYTKTLERLIQFPGASLCIYYQFNREKVEQQQKDFQYFRYSLRQNPQHRLAWVERDLRIRTRIMTMENGAFTLYISLAPKAGEDLRKTIERILGE